MLTTALGLVVLVVIAGILFFTPTQTDAANANNFTPGRIIDDEIFYNSTAMTAGQIQTFLNAKNPNCDTNGSQPASDWGRPDITRAQFAQLQGWHKPPYTCLKNYKQKTPQMEAASGLCSTIPAYTNRTAAQIINDVAKACDINPQVLLVLLQKEQSLVTDTWPLQGQYRNATGFACPDTAPCNPAYSGFFYQVYYAARQFNIYKAYPDTYNYRAGRSNKVYWQTSLGEFVNKTGNANDASRNGQGTRCGYQNVSIQNQATAALYIYTPYQPNRSAMANLYGTGDACSAYGNRNFWRMFTDWFGSTQTKALEVTRNLWVSPSNATTDSTLTASFIIKNSSNTAMTVNTLTVALRDSANNNLNFPEVKNITLQPGASYEYLEQRTVENPGDYRAWIAAELPSGGWSKDWPYSQNKSIVRERTFTVKGLPSVSLSRHLYFSRSGEYTTEDTSLGSFVIRNDSSVATKIDGLKISAEHSSGKRLDFPVTENVTLQPGQEYQYTARKRLELAGTYKIWVEVMTPYGQWSKTWPSLSSPSIIRERTIEINNPPRVDITRGLYVGPNPLIAGSTIGASFVIKNNEAQAVTVKELAIRARNKQGVYTNFPSVTNLQLQPGEEYTYLQYQQLDNVGSYTFDIAGKVNTDNWTHNWPTAPTPASRSITSTVKLPDIRVQRTMYHSPASAKAGDLTAVSFILKNYENRPVTIPALTVAVRDSSNRNLNYPAVQNITLQPGQEYTYLQRRTLPTKGVYRIWIATQEYSGAWTKTWPLSSSSSIVRERSITIK